MTDRAQNRRRHVRTRLSQDGSLGWGEAVHRCTIIDFSQAGAMVRASQPIPLDRPVSLAFGGHGAFMAEIVWQEGRRAGLCFHDPDWVGFKTYRP